MMTPPDNNTVILTRDLKKDYELGAETVHALRGVDMQIDRNEFVAIMGPSGSGKSTLLNLIGCLDTPTSGQYWLGGEEVSQLDDNDLVRQLEEMKEALRKEFRVGRTLVEQLADAVSAEEFERAARLRDEIARRRSGQR